MLISLEPANGEEILPLAKLKARLRVQHDDEDADLEDMRAQAIDFIERYTGVSLQARQFRIGDKQFVRAIPLLIGPVVSVDGISYDNSAGATIDLADTDWRLSGGYVMAAAGTTWPYASGDPGAVRVTFTAGLVNAEQESPLLISAVCVAVAALFDNREAPDWKAAMAVADSYRMPGL